MKSRKVLSDWRKLSGREGGKRQKLGREGMEVEGGWMGEERRHVVRAVPQVVQEYERAVIFRLGRLLPGGAKGPGDGDGDGNDGGGIGGCGGGVVVLVLVVVVGGGGCGGSGGCDVGGGTGGCCSDGGGVDGGGGGL